MAICGKHLDSESPPCPLPAGHWPERPHRAHSPHGNGQWVDYAENGDRLVQVDTNIPELWRYSRTERNPEYAQWLEYVAANNCDPHGLCDCVLPFGEWQHDATEYG